MRVLQINSVCGLGSTGRIATDIHNILKLQGHESYIAYGRKEAKNCENTIRIGNDTDIYSHVVLTRLFDRHGFGSKKATKNFIQEVERLDPDIIHLHNIHGYYINVEILFDYLKRANKPVIWTLHDCWPFTGHCTHFDYMNCRCWRENENEKCIQKRNYPSSFFINNSKSNFERKRKAFTGVKNLTIVTPSNWLAGLVKQSFLNEYPVQVINNGIDLNTFQPTTKEFRKNYNAENKFIILGVANNWGERKGLAYFEKLANKIDGDEVIALVGLTEKQKRTLPNNIIGITQTNNAKELADIYSAADVFVNPTLEDNFPTTNLEALASGTPLVTFNTGGSAECIDDNCGYVVEKSDFKALISSIQKVKQNGSSYYSIYAINRVKRLYDKKVKFNEYINLYKTVS